MKKTNTFGRITFIAVLAFLLVNVTEAKEPQFSGTWKINQGESQLNEQFSFAPSKMVITQDRNSIHIIRYVSRQGQEFTVRQDTKLEDASVD